MNRRGFLGAILAAAAAPAIVRADSLMRIVPRGLLVEVSGAAIAAGFPKGIVANMREDQAAYNRMLTEQIDAIATEGTDEAIIVFPSFERDAETAKQLTALLNRDAAMAARGLAGDDRVRDLLLWGRSPV